MIKFLVIIVSVILNSYLVFSIAEAQSISDIEAVEGVRLEVDISTNFPVTNAEKFRYTLVEAPIGLSISTITGVIVWTPNFDLLPPDLEGDGYQITIKIWDANKFETDHKNYTFNVVVAFLPDEIRELNRMQDTLKKHLAELLELQHRKNVLEGKIASGDVFLNLGK